MKLTPGGSTDKGQVRDGNEDGYVVDRRLQLFAVADGMGGHRAGEVASATALEALRAAVASGTGLGDAITNANTAVHDKAGDDDELSGMGTTLTAVVPDGHGVLVGHVGDSRAYLLRDGELRQLTTDHSLVEELVREGRLTEQEAAVHPQRSIITRALGVEGDGRGRRLLRSARSRRPAAAVLGRAHHDAARGRHRRRCCAGSRTRPARRTSSSTRRTRPAARTTSRRSSSTSRKTASTRSPRRRSSAAATTAACPS